MNDDTWDSVLGWAAAFAGAAGLPGGQAAGAAITTGAARAAAESETAKSIRDAAGSIDTGGIFGGIGKAFEQAGRGVKIAIVLAAVIVAGTIALLIWRAFS